jgi:hypothetical protein
MRKTYEVELTYGEGANTRSHHDGVQIAESRMPIRDSAQYFLDRGAEPTDMLIASRNGVPVAIHPLRVPVLWKDEFAMRADRLVRQKEFAQ